MSERDPRARDAMLVRVRAVNAVVAVVAAGATAAVSVAAAHAFKGHDGRRRVHRVAVAPRPRHSRAITVPGPERIPSIAGTPPPPPLAAPAQPPAAATPTPAPAPAPAQAPPETSGGS